MSVRNRLLVFILGSNLLVFLVFASFLRYIAYTTADTVNFALGKGQLQRFYSLLEYQLKFLESIVYSNSNWDDMYAYSSGRLNNSFVEENFDIRAFQSLGIDLLVVFDRKEELKVAYLRDITSDSLIQLSSSEIISQIKSGGFLSTGDTFIKTDMITLDNHLFLLSSGAILQGSGSGPFAGTLVLGQLLEDSRLKELSDISKLNLSYTPFSALNSNIYSSYVSGKITDSKVYKLTENDRPRIYSVLTSFSGSDLGMLSFDLDRGLLDRFELQMRLLVLVIFGFSSIVFLSGWMLINKLFVVRILSLAKEIKNIDFEKEYLKRVTISGNDEITDLQKSVNTLLLAVTDSNLNLKKANTELREHASVIEKYAQDLKKLNRFMTDRESRIGELRSSLEACENERS